MFSSNASAVSGDVNYIEDVFSTYLYTGTGASLTITNNIDLSTEGGLVWCKARASAYDNSLYDTARGINQELYSNTTGASYPGVGTLTAFNTTGFTLGSSSSANSGSSVSWTFRKQPKFFDVVTYTGNGTSQNIAHSLGSVPGCIMVKATSGVSNWFVYHRSLGNANLVYLNATSASASTTIWNSTDPTSTQFSINGTSGNASGVTYVAYIFAHDAGGFGLTGTDNVISCGTVLGGTEVNLGYEPQWVLAKASTLAANWFILDTMRGLTSNTSGDAQVLRPNVSDAETTNSRGYITSTGFTIKEVDGSPYIYVAIRRGPMKVPTDATKVFSPVAYTGTSATRTITGVGFPLDMNITMDRATHTYNVLSDRLRGLTCDGTATQPQLRTNATDAEASIANGLNGTSSSAMDGYTIYGAYSQLNASPDTYISYNYRRAPSFLDEVCYTTAAGTQSHNLGVSPELVITKTRGTADNWYVFTAQNGYGKLNLTDAWTGTGSGSGLGVNLANVTSTTIGKFDFLGTGLTAVSYMFATCAGVSKVGSYTGTATTQQINCGFAAGARFVMIKRTDSTGDWYVWDSARGIVAGNDPYSLINSAAAEVTSTDYVDTYAAGFELSSTAPAALNASGGTYIFLAIA